MYIVEKLMKTKTIQTILPDPHSFKEYIKRANLQACYMYIVEKLMKTKTIQAI